MFNVTADTDVLSDGAQRHRVLILITTVCLRRGKQCPVNTVYSGGDVLLTSTKDVVDRWREYFEDLLNLTDTPSSEEAGPWDQGIGNLISGADIAEVVKNVLGGSSLRPCIL